MPLPGFVPTGTFILPTDFPLTKTSTSAVPETLGAGAGLVGRALGLVAAGFAASEAVKRGIDFLQQRQNASASWDEPYHTGTGFPGHFYIRYHGYRHFFPLLALGRYQRAIDRGS